MDSRERIYLRRNYRGDSRKPRVFSRAWGLNQEEEVVQVQRDKAHLVERNKEEVKQKESIQNSLDVYRVHCLNEEKSETCQHLKRSI